MELRKEGKRKTNKAVLDETLIVYQSYCNLIELIEATGRGPPINSLIVEVASSGAHN